MIAAYSPYLFFPLVFVGSFCLSLLVIGLALGLMRGRFDDKPFTNDPPAMPLTATARAGRDGQPWLAVSLIPLLLIAGLVMILSLLPLGTLSAMVLLFALLFSSLPLLLWRGKLWQQGPVFILALILTLILALILTLWQLVPLLPPFPLGLLMAGTEPSLAVRQIFSAVLLFGFGLFFFLHDHQERVGMLSAGFIALGFFFLLLIVELGRALALPTPASLIEPQPLFAAIHSSEITSSAGLAAGALVLAGVCLGASYWMRPYQSFALSRGGRLAVGFLLGWLLLEGAWLLGPLPILVLLLLPLSQLLWRAGWQFYTRRSAADAAKDNAFPHAVGGMIHFLSLQAQGWLLVLPLSLLFAALAALTFWWPLTGLALAALFATGISAALLWLVPRQHCTGKSELAAAE